VLFLEQFAFVVPHAPVVNATSNLTIALYCSTSASLAL